jgi:transcriptional regulator with XRE-family HTH domain
MITVGEKLKQERESRNTTLVELSGTTGIGLSYLEALEHNEFDALPGRSFGKLYIRAYAKVLGFDPRPLIVEYDRQRQSWEKDLPPEARVARPVVLRPTVPVEAPRDELDSGAADDEAPQVEPEVRGEAPVGAGVQESSAETPTTPLTRRTPIVVGAATIAFLVVLVWILFALLPEGDEPGRVPGEAGTGEASEPPSPSPAGGEASRESLQIVTEPAREKRPLEPPVGPAEDEATALPGNAPTSGAPLTVDDFGVGRRMARRRLDGRDDRFREGELVWFSTRVLGGSRGDSIRHVWLREGKPVQSIELAVEGPHWRTHSNKTLWGVGAWSVEARDPEGRVLATASFTCTPRSP